MQSALNAASALLKDMSNNGLVEPGSFRMDDLFEANPFQDVLKTGRADHDFALSYIA
jgi:hypothetical protein